MTDIVKDSSQEKEYRASIDGVRVPPRKARLAAGLIRNARKPLTVREANLQLVNSPMKSSEVLSKLLRDAIANATYKGAREELLVVHRVAVDKGVTLKRQKSRSKGSTHPILRRSSHFSIVLKESQSLQEDKQAKRAARTKQPTT